MKIKTQTESVLSIKEGSSSITIFLGSLFFLVGIYIGYTELNSPSNSIGTLIGNWSLVLIFIIFGLAAIFYSYVIFVDFDKTSGQVIYQEKGLIRSKKVTYNISDIVRIETRNGWRTETTPSFNDRGNSISKNKFIPNQISKTKQVPTSQSFLIFKDGTVLALDRESTPPSGIIVSGLNANADNTIANTIATFIGVPFQAISPIVTETPINTGFGNGIQL